MKTAGELAREKIRNGGSITKKELAAAYGISKETLKQRINKIPGFQKGFRRHILMPDELTLIFLSYGNPAEQR